jgi:hypothetical protein
MRRDSGFRTLGDQKGALHFDFRALFSACFVHR